MTKARTALAIAILLAVALPVSMLAQSEAPPAPPQGQMGDHQGRMSGPPNPQQHLDHLSRMLNLTDDQKVKVKPILENADTQMKALRQDTSLSPQDRHAKMRDIHENAMSQVRSVLTPEQQAKLDQMQKQHEGMGRGKGMGHGQDMGPKGEGQQQGPPPQN
jgi:periplasmic protein CpxP/Spy